LDEPDENDDDESNEELLDCALLEELVEEAELLEDEPHGM
jgi:hypothetical protein